MSVKDSLSTMCTTGLRLSRHFTVREMFSSATATRLQISNCPPTHVKLREVLSNLVRLCKKLEVLRAAHGKPIIVNSGYRCKALNEAVKGNVFSAHQHGRAVDITSTDFVDLKQALEFLSFDDVTYYYDDTKKYIHFQIKNKTL